MTFQNNFVLAVKDSQKKTLREYDGKVYLPFGSEYSVFLKNNHYLRCKVKVEIDGMDVLGGKELIIQANESVNLERFFDVDKKFLFVKSNDSRVQDPTNKENGWLKATFYPEELQCTLYQSNNNDEIFVNRGVTHLTNNGMYFSSGSFTSCCVGATVEGGKSDQSFISTGSFAASPYGTVLELMMVGSNESITVSDTKKKYCSNCGAKVKFNDNFCSGCGTRL